MVLELSLGMVLELSLGMVLELSFGVVEPQELTINTISNNPISRFIQNLL
jgi:hypothetical protein